MVSLFASAAMLVLTISASLAQEAADKPTSSIPKGQPSAPPIGAATIPPEFRSNATKDIPMGNGKPNTGESSAGGARNGKAKK
jgi:hypothetical protein